MKHIAVLILLGWCVLGYSQQTDSTTIFRAKRNTGLLHIQQLAGIPLGYIVVSCNVYRTSKGEMTMTYCNMENLAAAKAFFNRLLPYDKISLENVVVMKDGVKMKWPGKVPAFVYNDRLGVLNREGVWQ